MWQRGKVGRAWHCLCDTECRQCEPEPDGTSTYQDAAPHKERACKRQPICPAGESARPEVAPLDRSQICYECPPGTYKDRAGDKDCIDYSVPFCSENEYMANKESIGSSGSAGSRVGHTILHSVHNGLVKVLGNLSKTF